MSILHPHCPSPSKHTSHSVEDHHEHSLVTTTSPIPSATNNTEHDILASASTSSPSPTLKRATTSTFHIYLPPSTHNLAQTYIQQTYPHSHPPKRTTHTPHATIPFKLIHLHYLRSTLHKSYHISLPDPIIYHYHYLTCQLRKVQHNYSIQLHTCQHTFILTRPSRLNDDHTTPQHSTFILIIHILISS